jgi:hypothetical protein
MLYLAPDPAQVVLQAYAITPAGAAKLDVASGTVRVYSVAAGSEVDALAAQALVNVATNKWRYIWAPGSLAIGDYVAEFILIDGTPVTTRISEDVLVRDVESNCDAALVAYDAATGTDVTSAVGGLNDLSSADAQAAAAAALAAYDAATGSDVTVAVGGLNDLSSADAQAASAAALTAYDAATGSDVTVAIGGLNDLSSADAQAAASAALTAYDAATGADVTTAVGGLNDLSSADAQAAAAAALTAYDAATGTDVTSAVGGLNDLSAADAADAVLDEIVSGHTTAGSLAALIQFLVDIEGGRWRIVGDQMIFYKEDNLTEVTRFDLKDASGNPTMNDVMERTKV